MHFSHLRSHAAPGFVRKWVLSVAFGVLAPGLSVSPEAALAVDPPPYEGEWGSQGSGDGEFLAPQGGIAVSEFGEVFVADTGNHRVQKFDPDGVYLGQWGSQGSGPGQFQSPYGIAVGAYEHVFVTDFDVNRVQKFDQDGNYLGEWGVPGLGNGQFYYPLGIAVSYFSGEVYVVDMANHRVQKFDQDGNYLGQWGSLGAGNGQFDHPIGVAVGGDGSVYVSDSQNHRVQMFDADGNYILQWGTLGTGPGEFQDPYGLGLDCKGYVYVTDPGNSRVQKFDGGGSFVLEWGTLGSGPGEFDAPNAFAAYINHAIPVSGKRALTSPLYVLDTRNNRVQKFEGPCCASFLCDTSTATVPGPATVMITPSGEGPTLASLNATVTVQILDCCDQGIAGYPFQDIWLQDTGTGEIALCQGGSVADANTDADGITTISHALAGGGWTQNGMVVVLSGLPLVMDPLPLSVNSPDINGDLVVDLVDLGVFAVDYNNASYDFRSDFTGDGIENLADIGQFAIYYGDECP